MSQKRQVGGPSGIRDPAPTRQSHTYAVTLLSHVDVSKNNHDGI